MEEIIEMITSGAMISAMIAEMHRVPADKIIGLGSQGHTMYDLKIC